MAIEVDNLFQALDIILDQRLQKINYDKTDICIIVDDSDAKNGRYWVSPNNGETRYEAYSESEEYKKDEHVRVSILNGDYTQKKFIVGKYVVDDAIVPITYVSPLDSVIDITGNMISDKKSTAQYGLISNGATMEIPIWSADLALDSSYQDLQASGIYNTISLSASFKTLLDNYDIRSGSFGLRLDIYVKLNPTSDKYIIRSVFMDSSEMFGNPYAFSLYTPQHRKYDLSALGAVDKLSLWFYQRGDFSYYNLKERKTIPIDATTIPGDNILMKNVKIGFGSDLTLIEDNTLQAYSPNSKNYHLIVTKEDNEKEIGFLWYNKDSNNQYLGYSDGLVDFEYDEGEVVYTNKLDKNWNKVTKDVLDENGNPIKEFAKDEENKVILVSVLTESGYEILLNIPPEEALIELSNEVALLRTNLTNEYQRNEIGYEEYLLRSADITNYFNVKQQYLQTPYRNEEREQRVEDERAAAIESATLQYNAGSLTDVQYQNLVIQINALYDGKLNEIYNERLQKTYVLQNKQQDVLIQKVAHYDEFTYLDESAIDARLTAQSGKEGIPSDANSLKLAADLADIKPIMEKTFNLVTKDIVAALRQFRDRTLSIDPITSAINDILLTPTKDAAGQIHGSERNNILAWYDNAEKQKQLMYDIYTQLLEYNYLHQQNLLLHPAEQKQITITDAGKELQEWDKTPLYQSIQDLFITDLIPMVEAVFTTAQSVIDAEYSGYQGIYDTYKKKTDKIIDTIKENLEKMESIVGVAAAADTTHTGNHYWMQRLRPYDPNYQYVDYHKKDFSHCNNKYSIYWYRYEPGYVSDDRLYPTEWRRLITKADFGIETDSDEIVYNYGLPVYDDFIQRDGKYYFSDVVKLTNTRAIRLMDGQRSEEKYKIVLFYNHEMFESEELVFTNLDEVIDVTTADTDAIVITHGSNSQETYQSYGLNNFLVNLADASKVRELEVHYEGLLAGDEALANAQVYWYIPNAATMLTCDDKHLTETLGFYSDLNIADEEKPDYSLNGYTCYYKTIGTETMEVSDDPETPDVNESETKITAKTSDLTFTYKIKDYYLPTSSRNEILCKVVKDEYSFEAQMVISFTSYGTSGTDYTLAITPATSQIAATISNSLPLDITLYDYNNQSIPIASTLLSGQNGATNFTLEWEGPTSFISLERYDANDNIIGASITVRTAPQPDDSLMYGVLKASAICPVEYTVNAEADQEEDEVNVNKPNARNVNLVSYYPIPYSAGNYYIEGATTIVYDSMGSNPSYYKDPYKIFTCNTNENLAEKKIVRAGVETDKLKYDVLWRIVYYKMGEHNSVVKLDKETHKDYNICRNYMPTLNEKGGLNVANMYMGDMDCWCAVECWIKDLETATYDTKYSLIWVQPIFILQNRYPSQMLNSWDGSLTIDKKNGTILSSLVGAGRKTRDNTFEGVLMGDIEGSAGIVNAGNKSGLGIYGFNDGAQSFGFNVDGTGFIGKSGRGRILFDGNEGLIQSASYTANSETPFGMQIDFDDGSIDIRGGMEYTDADWTNEILTRYAEVLNKHKYQVDRITGSVIETTEYVIDPRIMRLDMQRALLKKIEFDINEGRYANMYAEGRAVAQEARDAGRITAAEYQTIFDDLYAKELEKKYYALTTLQTARLAGEFIVDEIRYELTVQQYNAIINEVDEYILSETYDGQYAAEHLNYKTRYGILKKALQETDDSGNPKPGHQSHIRLDVCSPYFYIVSEQGKRIVNIGDGSGFDFAQYPYILQDGKVILDESASQSIKNSWAEPDGASLDKGYYFKSNNFTYTAFNIEDNSTSTPGSGFLLDLTNGVINAFNLTIASKNILLDSSGEADPYFIIKDDHGHNLFYAGTTDYYLKTCNYCPRIADAENITLTYGSGMKIDLGESSFDAYNFYLMGESNYGATAGSYLLLDSYTPQLIIHLQDSTLSRNVNLFKASPEEYYLHSANFVEGEVETTVIQICQATTIGGSYNVRTGPGTSYSRIKTMPKNSEVTVYEDRIADASDPTSGQHWYKIALESEQWINEDAFKNGSGEMAGLGEWQDYTISNAITPSVGVELDMMRGYFKVHDTPTTYLYIDSTAELYPLEIGVFKVDWGGGIKGGSENPWYITKAGNVSFSQGVFNNLTSSYASLYSADLEVASINGLAIGTSLSLNDQSFLTYEITGFPGVAVQSSSITMSDYAVLKCENIANGYILTSSTPYVSLSLSNDLTLTGTTDSGESVTVTVPKFTALAGSMTISSGYWELLSNNWSRLNNIFPSTLSFAGTILAAEDFAISTSGNAGAGGGGSSGNIGVGSALEPVFSVTAM